jgi:hypothetical protein
MDFPFQAAHQFHVQHAFHPFHAVFEVLGKDLEPFEGKGTGEHHVEDGEV